MKAWHQYLQRIPTVLVFQKWGWNQDHAHSLWLLGPKKNYSLQPGSSGKWIRVDILPRKPDKCVTEMKQSADQVQVNSPTWHPITTSELTGLTSITDWELMVSLGGTQPGKENPSPPCREGRGDRVTLCQVPRAVGSSIQMKWLGAAEWVVWRSP